MGWFQTHAKQKSVDKNGNPIPWFNYSFLYFIEPRLKKEFSVFEYGCGNSSLWFAARVKSILSIEHNKTWFETISQSLPSNAKVYFKEESDYAKSINEFATFFDIIIIDGIDRNNCIVFAMNKLKEDGVVIFDNLERDDYKDAINNVLKSGYKLIEFKGIASSVSTSTITGILYKENNCLGI
jgi:predicted O-methyltransferase YrrM